MSSLDLALLFFLVLAVLNYRAHRSVLYPPFLFCAMWLLDLAVFRSGLIEVDPLHGNTLAIVAAGATAFSAGGLLASLAPRALLRIHLFPPRPERQPTFLRNMLMIVLLCGLPALFYQVYQFSKLQGGGFNILAQARLEMIEMVQNEETSQSFVLSYFTLIAILASLLFATEKKDRQFWVVSVLAFIGCILSTGRVSLLILISGLSAIRLLQTKQESLLSAMRLLRWPVVLFAALFIGLIFTNKQTEGMTGGVTDIATFSVLSYIVGPLAAFDKVVQYPADFIMTTSHTFQFPLTLAAKLHLTDYTMPPKVGGFLLVPFPTNVYTVFKFYYLELGTFGTLVLLLFIGLLHSLLYLKARQGGRFSTYLFAYSMFPVMLAIFDDSYYETGLYLRVFVFGLLYFSLGSMPLSLLPAIKLRWQQPRPVPANGSTDRSS
jgi:oligosaccharide repeat unit polymerase